MMKILSLYRSVLKLAVLLLLPTLAGAQTYFTDTQLGDVDAGFRKTGSAAEKYEMVAYLGNITNFMALTPGTQITITNYTYQQLTNMCPNGFGNLQWSVFSSTVRAVVCTNGASGSLLTFPKDTCWYTLPRTNVNVLTTPPGRVTSSDVGTGLESPMISVGANASTLSETLASSADQGNTNTYNNYLVILEPTSGQPYANTADNLTAQIGDSQIPNPNFGDFGGLAINYSVENVTSNSFTSPVISDFYVNVPSGGIGDTDPINPNSTTAEYLGYFTLATNGIMTYTAAPTNTPLSISAVTASVTNGFGPLTVIFTNTDTGTITNWVWNFGNGTIITNTTGGNVTNTYATSGSYTVTLTVYGSGESATNIVANYIVASPTPKIGSLALTTGKLVFSGTNCPSGVQYRILSSTNLTTTLANWTPVYTNTFGSNGAFSYTNSIGTTNSFFLLVSP